MNSHLLDGLKKTMQIYCSCDIVEAVRTKTFIRSFGKPHFFERNEWKLHGTVSPFFLSAIILSLLAFCKKGWILVELEPGIVGGIYVMAVFGTEKETLLFGPWFNRIVRK